MDQPKWGNSSSQECFKLAKLLVCKQSIALTTSFDIATGKVQLSRGGRSDRFGAAKKRSKELIGFPFRVLPLLLFLDYFYIIPTF